METVVKRGQLKARAVREATQIKEVWGESIPLIADIGANIGYYSEAFYEVFDGSIIHSYEPHPYNLSHLKNVARDVIFIHEYGLFDKDTKLMIGVPESRPNNNGLFSIHHTTNGVEVDLKNANKEEIRPDIVKIDVEGAESQVLSCTEFFENTKLILIEIVVDDNFNNNDDVVSKLKSMGFTHIKNTSKNNQLWSR